jgi:4-amino-4-deoxy-L-arabinose transferase-like glycosyltransferase
MKSIMKKYFFSIILGLIILLFIVIKFQYLVIPYFWDESWSYASAIFNLAEHGPSMVPGCIDVELYRGHPMFYYFLSSLCMKIFGSSVLVMHSYSLLISILLIISIYILCNHFYDSKTGILAVLFLIPQTEFFAQSTMLLPEVFLALLVVVSIYFYFRRKWLWFCITATMLVMTKESGIVIMGAFLFDKIILDRFYRTKDETSTKRIRETLFIIIPCLIFILYALINRILFGWYFFPQHTHEFAKNLKHFMENMNNMYQLLFFSNGRAVLIIFIGISIVYLIIKKQLRTLNLHVIFFLLIYILFFFMFSGINFFVSRYLMSVYPLYAIIAAIFIVKLFEKRTLLLILGVSFTVFVIGRSTFNYKLECDVSPYFINSVKLHQEVVHFCEDQNWQNESISTNFLMTYNLREPFLGYLKNPSMPFKNLKGTGDTTSAIFIFYSTEVGDNRRDTIMGNKKFKMLKRFEKDPAWAEIYQRINN